MNFARTAGEIANATLRKADYMQDVNTAINGLFYAIFAKNNPVVTLANGYKNVKN